VSIPANEGTCNKAHLYVVTTYICPYPLGAELSNMTISAVKIIAPHPNVPVPIIVDEFTREKGVMIN
jgi:hypothetical protein